MPAALVLFAHPAIRQSRVQRRLRAAAESVPDVTVHDLYDAYPDFDVDVDAEQQRLLAHDVVLLQHPLYWYSVPPLVKQWFDLVLEHGWAYGKRGCALRDKFGGVAISAGGRAAAYRPDGFNRYTLPELLRPVEATLRLCGMRWLPPFFVTGTHAMDDAEVDAAAARYRRWLSLLTGGGLAPAQLAAPDADAALALAETGG